MSLNFLFFFPSFFTLLRRPVQDEMTFRSAKLIEMYSVVYDQKPCYENVLLDGTEMLFEAVFMWKVLDPGKSRESE